MTLNQLTDEEDCMSMRVIGVTMTTDGRITGTRKRKKVREFERKK